MREPDEHAAWTDSFHDSQGSARRPPAEQQGWYGTACGIAAALLALWVLYT